MAPIPGWRRPGIGATSATRTSSKEQEMANHVYKKIEIVGSSSTGIEDAIKNALSKAAESVHNLRWFEVVETRGLVEDNQVAYWQVTVKIGFTVD
jgi:flavin-binding protein dodecin